MVNPMTRVTVRAALALALAMLVVGAIAFPTGASAAISPKLTIAPGAGSSAGHLGSLQLAISFGETAGDAAKSVTIGLPPGLFVNQQIDKGGCLGATAPAPQCQIGSGVATVAGVATPVTLYLVKPPAAGALAGVAVVGGPLSLVGQLQFRAVTELGTSPSAFAGTEISFADLSASAVSALNLTLTDLTLPSSCKATDVDLWANSAHDPTFVSATAPYHVGGCKTLGYSPGLAEHITRTKGRTGIWTVRLTVPSGQSATEALTIRFPLPLTLNPKLDPCLEGITCTVGTVSGASPVFAPGLFKGTITMSGTSRAPTLALVMPAPADLRIPGVLSPIQAGLTLLPQIPFTKLRLRFTGNSLGPMFVVQCFPSTYKATVQPYSGNTGPRLTGPVKETGCHNKPPRRPQASVSLNGLAHGDPQLSLTAVQGLRSPMLKKLSIGLPPGLSLATTGPASNPSSVGHQLGLSSGRVIRATVRSQWLSVTLKHSVRRTSLSLRRPLLIESHQLAGAIRAGRSRTQWLTVGMTDFDGHLTKVTIPVAVGASGHGA